MKKLAWALVIILVAAAGVAAYLYWPRGPQLQKPEWAYAVTTQKYLIEDGKITVPVKGATLIGDGPSALTRVEMIGDDFCFDPGVGVCGKAGQGVPVGVGQPSLKIKGLTVGGTSL